MREQSYLKYLTELSPEQLEEANQREGERRRVVDETTRVSVNPTPEELEKISALQRQLVETPNEQFGFSAIGALRIGDHLPIAQFYDELGVNRRYFGWFEAEKERIAQRFPEHRTSAALPLQTRFAEKDGQWVIPGIPSKADLNINPRSEEDVFTMYYQQHYIRGVLSLTNAPEFDFPDVVLDGLELYDCYAFETVPAQVKLLKSFKAKSCNRLRSIDIRNFTGDISDESSVYIVENAPSLKSASETIQAQAVIFRNCEQLSQLNQVNGKLIRIENCPQFTAINHIGDDFVHLALINTGITQLSEQAIKAIRDGMQRDAIIELDEHLWDQVVTREQAQIPPLTPPPLPEEYVKSFTQSRTDLPVPQSSSTLVFRSDTREMPSYDLQAQLQKMMQQDNEPVSVDQLPPSITVDDLEHMAREARNAIDRFCDEQLRSQLLDSGVETLDSLSINQAIRQMFAMLVDPENNFVGFISQAVNQRYEELSTILGNLTGLIADLRKGITHPDAPNDGDITQIVDDTVTARFPQIPQMKNAALPFLVNHMIHFNPAQQGAVDERYINEEAFAEIITTLGVDVPDDTPYETKLDFIAGVKACLIHQQSLRDVTKRVDALRQIQNGVVPKAMRYVARAGANLAGPVTAVIDGSRFVADVVSAAVNGNGDASQHDVPVDLQPAQVTLTEETQSSPIDLDDPLAGTTEGTLSKPPRFQGVRNAWSQLSQLFVGRNWDAEYQKVQGQRAKNQDEGTE